MQWNYDDRRFGPAEVGPGSVIGHYHQQDRLISVEFAGDSVQAGRLLGICSDEGVIDAAYCQIMRDGEVVSGTVQSSPTLLADGRILLTEQWQRADGSSGVSHIYEVAARPVGAATQHAEVPVQPDAIEEPAP